MTHSDLASLLTHFLGRAGVSTEGITTHSIRKGGASVLHRAGTSIPALKQHGTWLSDSYKNYVHFNTKDKLAVTKNLYKFLNLT